ncbi:MAG TPA: hypothetical protein VN397_04355 [Candidatus Methylomirabilis sp.]|nr:hypothetical protein [Candidatus Methylomirabilis sp.]
MGSEHPNASIPVQAGPQSATHATREGAGTIADGLTVVGIAIGLLRTSNDCPKGLNERIQAIHVEYLSIARDLTDAYRESGSAIRAMSLCAAIIELQSALSTDLDLTDGLSEEDRSALENLISIPARFAPYFND